MSRKTWSSVGSVALVVVVALVGLWVKAGPGGSGHDAPDDTGRNVPTASATRAPGTGSDPRSGLPYVAVAALPPQAQQTLRLIDRGGPYPYPDHDDMTFGNYEGILPKESSGYYREYTVITPGSDDRGARRIIKGADGELYYTDDHYSSFRRIVR